MPNFDLTREGFESLLATEVAALDPEAQAILTRYAVPVFRTAHEFAGKSGRAATAVWVVAKSGDIVLGYDEVEAEFGIGTFDAAGLVTHWGTFGERLRWSLIRFPDSQFA